MKVRFRPILRGLKYGAIIIGAVFTTKQRKLLRRMVLFSRYLPRQFDRPLPEMMAHLTPISGAAEAKELQQNAALIEHNVRRLADAVAVWHLHSPLGICLRRSLLRYHFLRKETQIPVQIVFGARLKSSQEGGGIGGHAWLMLQGKPYYEKPEDYRDFAKMYVYPEDKQHSETPPDSPNHAQDTGSVQNFGQTPNTRTEIT